MDDLVGLAVIVILVVVAGAICGLIALVQLNALKQEVAVLRAKITHLQTHKMELQLKLLLIQNQIHFNFI